MCWLCQSQVAHRTTHGGHRATPSASAFDISIHRISECIAGLVVVLSIGTYAPRTSIVLPDATYGSVDTCGVCPSGAPDTPVWSKAQQTPQSSTRLACDATRKDPLSPHTFLVGARTSPSHLSLSRRVRGTLRRLAAQPWVRKRADVFAPPTRPTVISVAYELYVGHVTAPDFAKVRQQRVCLALSV